jgi:hypothetical protein
MRSMVRDIHLFAIAVMLGACAAEPARDDRASRAGSPEGSTASSVANPTSQPSALTPEDFVLAGLPETADTAVLRRQLGSPDSIAHFEHPFEPGAKLPVWYYPDLMVLFNWGEEPSGYTVTGGRYPTHRGVQVGDTQERVRSAYGSPTYGDDLSWDYVNPAEESEMHLIRFRFRDERLQEYFIGWILD